MTIPDTEVAGLLARLEAAALPPQLACTVCGQALDVYHVDLGTHPHCDPPLPPADPPPSTLAALETVLHRHEQASPRSMQVALGPSDIAVTCDRRLGYKLHNTPPQPEDLKWERTVGTVMHAHLAAALLADNRQLGRERWLVEQRVWPDPHISGSCDVYDTDTDTVVDWKVVGPSTLGKVRPGPRTPNRTPTAEYIAQIMMYGRGWQRAGRRPRWVRIAYLPRLSEFTDGYEWTAPYDRQLADAALDRMYRLTVMLKDLDVAGSPERWGAVPATVSHQCSWCPYHRRFTPADATGCPGDVETDTRKARAFAEGIIAGNAA